MKHLPVRAALLVAALYASLSIPGILRAQEAGDFPLRPGAIHPPPAQRGLNEIDELPGREALCPACGYTVRIPLVDKLMRTRPGLAGRELVWEMHAAGRDADGAPYPGKNKLSFQADIVICPDCGFAAPAGKFEEALPGETRKWALETLRPNLRAAEKALLGKRAADMAEADIIAFFNRQEEIPDSVRTEHYRIYALAAHLPKMVQADATRIAAWALRRESAGRPRGEFLAARWEAVEAAAKSRNASAAPAELMEIVRFLTGKNRAGKDRSGYGDRFAARLMLASWDIRQGFHTNAIERLETLQKECRERFLKPDQDPFWPNTSVRASRSFRLTELETIRSEIEAELAVRLHAARAEQELLEQAADLLRAAIVNGECPERENALYHAYLVGEFLRRCNHLSLAAEWFKNLVNLADADAPVVRAARKQLEVVKQQAGEHVNLLSALGQDGEVFEKLREIVQTPNSQFTIHN